MYNPNFVIGAIQHQCETLNRNGERLRKSVHAQHNLSLAKSF